MTLESYTYIPRAQEFLANQLYQGSLSLFLGAGVSIASGLPSWKSLIHKLIVELNRDRGRVVIKLPDLTNASADDLQGLAGTIKEEVGSQEELVSLLEKVLYFPEMADGFPFELLKSDILISIGALFAGSKRGHVQEVVTLNYDNILEWMVSINGMVSQTIYDLPQLEGDEDVRIFHPHGFVPHPKYDLQSSDFVILDLDSVNVRLGTPGDIWFEKVRHILRSRLCLFIGLSPTSFKDRALAPLLTTVGREVEKDRPLGFWVVSEVLTEPQKKAFLRNNMVPIYLPISEIPKFLLRICQDAAKMIHPY